MKTKICTKCHEEKPLDEFGRDKCKKDLRRIYCKKCECENQRAKRAKNPEKWKKYYRENYNKNREKKREQNRKSQNARRAKNPEKHRVEEREAYTRKIEKKTVLRLSLIAGIIKKKFMKGNENGK